MLVPWVREEVNDVDLNDKRLNHRFTEVLVPHIEATRRRIAEQPLVILVQDTTEVDLTRPEQQVAGVGPLDGSARRGVFLHPLIGFTPNGTPLGAVYAKVWAPDDSPPPTKFERSQKRKHTPIEKKESMRWLDGLWQAREESRLARQVRFVCVADSEADIYELLAESQAEPDEIDWIVRASQNRALQCSAENEGENAEHSGAEMNYIRQQVLAGEVLFTNTIQVRGRKAKISCESRGRRQPRESRTAEVEIRAARVTLRAPWRYDRKLPEVSVNVVLVREVIQYYCVRWMIEIFFRTLKSGCRVEQRRFEHIDRLLPCLGVYLIVTWRTLFVCRLGREFPEISCEAVFEPAEWKSVYHVTQGESPPSSPPTLKAMVRMVAQLGGYVNRKRNDEPGPHTVWLGLQRTIDMVRCWKIFGPEARTDGILV